eukprot:GEMP01054820.1.p3 GENE.GEMP01054820.1~~GEMP01054820.1.p3  ORF type:complete len:106 (-),score=12.94 GEMP01054820.1:196-513(-)
MAPRQLPAAPRRDGRLHPGYSMFPPLERGAFHHRLADLVLPQAAGCASRPDVLPFVFTYMLPSVARGTNSSFTSPPHGAALWPINTSSSTEFNVCSSVPPCVKRL